MQKTFEVAQNLGAWDVRHNHVHFRTCHSKREAIRLALSLGRLQQRLGDDAEILLLDQDKALKAVRRLRAR
jgi:hypothetical protein